MALVSGWSTKKYVQNVVCTREHTGVVPRYVIRGERHRVRGKRLLLNDDVDGERAGISGQSQAPANFKVSTMKNRQPVHELCAHALQRRQAWDGNSHSTQPPRTFVAEPSQMLRLRGGWPLAPAPPVRWAAHLAAPRALPRPCLKWYRPGPRGRGTRPRTGPRG